MATYSEYASKADKEKLTLEQINSMVNPSIGNGVISLADLAFAEWIAATDSELQQNYVTYRQYYDGNHTQQLTDRMKQFLELVPNISFNYNFVPLAIDIVRERMKIVRFDVEGENENTPDDMRQGGENGLLMKWFKNSGMDARQADVHHNTLVDADGFTIAEWDNETQMPIISSKIGYTASQIISSGNATNLTFETGTGSGVYVAYDEENQNKLKFAANVWRVQSGRLSGKTRLNVYTDDFVAKFVSGSGGYIPYIDFDDSGNKLDNPILWQGNPTDAPGWPIPWIDKNGEPIGITVTHFDLRKSLVHDLIAFQDAINKAAIDEMGGADIEGFGMITLISQQPPYDDDGNATVEIGPRKILWAPDGNWGSMGSGDIAALSSLVDKAIQRLAQRGRVPLKYFQVTGQVSSADSQNADDSGMVSLIEGISTIIGNSWEDTMDACRRVHNAFGDTELPENRITAVWDSFERIDRQESEKKKAETQEIKARTFDVLLINNVPRMQAALLAGYTQEEANDMIQIERTNLDGRITQSGASGTVESIVTGALTDNLETDKGLNGAQINAALDILEGVVIGTTTETVAIELLVAVGIDRARAEVMVRDTKSNASEPIDVDGITQ